MHIFLSWTFIFSLMSLKSYISVTCLHWSFQISLLQAPCFIFFHHILLFTALFFTPWVQFLSFYVPWSVDSWACNPIIMKVLLHYINQKKLSKCVSDILLETIIITCVSMHIHVHTHTNNNYKNRKYYLHTAQCWEFHLDRNHLLCCLDSVKLLRGD